MSYIQLPIFMSPSLQMLIVHTVGFPVSASASLATAGPFARWTWTCVPTSPPAGTGPRVPVPDRTSTPATVPLALRAVTVTWMSITACLLPA